VERAIVFPYAKEPYQSLHRLLGQSGKVKHPDALSLLYFLLDASGLLWTENVKRFFVILFENYVRLHNYLRKNLVTGNKFLRGG
jgi:hypothetical protein